MSAGDTEADTQVSMSIDVACPQDIFPHWQLVGLPVYSLAQGYTVEISLGGI